MAADASYNAAAASSMLRKELEEELDVEHQEWKQSQERQAYQFRQKAQNALSLDDMAIKQNVTRRDIFKAVLGKNRKNSAGCMTLPVTITFVALYAFSARLHEDITNVFMLESALRESTRGQIEEIETVDDIWNYLRNDVPADFFKQVDMYGDPLPKDKWSMVDLFSKVQGSVILTQSRDSGDPWGEAWHGPYNMWAAAANDNNEGFVPVSMIKVAPKSLPRRLAEVLKSDMFKYVPQTSEDAATYEFALYPDMPLVEIEARLAYLQQRVWLDQHTKMLTVRVLCLNAEMGRPRLVQMLVKFCFSRGGAIYWRIELETLFLEVFPPGMLSKGADFLWLVLLLITTCITIYHIHAHIREQSLQKHCLTFTTVLEWFIIMLGWAYLSGLVMMGQKISLLKKDLEVVMDLPSTATRAETEEANSNLRQTATDMIEYTGLYRLLISYYCIILIFRFFTAFRVQPRLAVVTNTLIAVATDLFHFLFIFTPCFVAYVISGNILFGRRIRDFATITASFGAMFRVLYENEYPWEDLSAEHFVTAAIWVWSFLLFVVLVMLNLVLAIILDTYNEVRQKTDAADTIFLFVEILFKRLFLSRSWVHDKDLEGLISEMDLKTTITKGDILETVPWMTTTQRDMLFRSCRNEMSWQAKSDLHKRNLLKLSASVKLSIDEINKTMFKLARDKEKLEGQLEKEKSNDAKKQSEALHAAFRQQGKSRAFPGMQPVPGGYYPPLLAPDQVSTEQPQRDEATIPEWLRDLRSNTTMIDNWMAAIKWQLSELQWKWYVVNNMWEEDEPSEYSSRGDKRSIHSVDDDMDHLPIMGMHTSLATVDTASGYGSGIDHDIGDTWVRTVGGVPIL
mmetsp:Transcript_119286/g.216847  ORF Transcript_119286/g.216847 Transcript_119286/m.216847 type:complete len:852 (-) Transcript_119286:48-2603(-)